MLQLIKKFFVVFFRILRIGVTSKTVLFKIIKLTYSLIKINGIKSAILVTFYQTLRSINSVFNYRKMYLLKTRNKIKTRKINSDTVFILGSGPTINELTDKNWKFISSKDSWGFNFWFCHDFVPKFYFIQSPKRHSHDKLITKIFKSKSEKYRTTNFIIRGDILNKGLFHKTQLGCFLMNCKFNFEFMSELIFDSKYEGNTTKILEKLYEYKFFENINNDFPAPKFGSTIGELIPLALKFGYKNIILCGIDMKDSSHFYDVKKYTDEFPELSKLSLFHKKSKPDNHPHMNPKIRKHTLKDIITDMDQFAKENFSAKIFVSSEKSTLYPEISKYDFQSDIL